MSPVQCRRTSWSMALKGSRLGYSTAYREQLITRQGREATKLCAQLPIFGLLSPPRRTRRYLEDGSLEELELGTFQDLGSLQYV